MTRKLTFPGLVIVLLVPCFSGWTQADDFSYKTVAALFKVKRYDEAIRYCSEILEKKPRSYEAYHLRGIAWAMKGDLDRAIADYSKAIEISPQHYLALTNRGIARHDKGEYNRALDDYTKAVTFNPRYVKAYLYRGLTWSKKGLYGRAIVDYKTALGLAPDNAEAYNYLAWILACCPRDPYRNGTEAVALAKKAISLKTKARFFDSLAAGYAELGDFKKAVQLQKKALSQLSKNHDDGELAAFKKRLSSYENQAPWREPLPANSQEKDVLTFLQSWRKSWEAADLENYLRFYHKNAKQDRVKGRHRIGAKKKALWRVNQPREISFGPLDIHPHPSGMRVVLEQIYRAKDGYQDRGLKSLILTPSDRGWLILEEQWKTLSTANVK